MNTAAGPGGACRTSRHDATPASVRIVGLGSGQGDDRLGFAAVAALERRGVPAGCEVQVCGNPATELLALLAGTPHAILVDAMVDGGAAGRVLCCAPGTLAARTRATSSHGVSVDGVLELAAALGLLPPRLTLLGITIDPAQNPHGAALSPAVGAALPALVDRVLATVNEGTLQ